MGIASSVGYGREEMFSYDSRIRTVIVHIGDGESFDCAHRRV